MKVRMTAALLLGASAAGAIAQSSVTIYGTIDLALAKANGGLSNNPSQNTLTTSNAYQVAQGRSSRLGFRGNEDLGGGLSAQFQIEHRFLPDTGAVTNANVFWQGMSYVQLTSVDFGKVYLGRVLTPGYISPSFGGFSINTSTSLSENTNLGRMMTINGTYDSGPWLVGASAEKVFKGIYQDQSLYSAGLSYNFGFTRLMAYAARSTYGVRTTATGINYFTSQALPASLGGGVMNTVNGANRTHAKVYEIGAVTPIGAGALKTGYIRVDPDGPNNLIQKLGVGYDYFLSKRTKIYLDGSYAKEDTLSKSKVVALGIRHDF